MIKDKAKRKDSSQSFLKGAFILTLSMVAVKLCGLAQKVLLTNLYGMLGENFAATGTGLFSNAYEIYVPLFTLATVGFPIAVSRLVSESYAKERYNDVRQIHRVAKPFFIIMGTVCFLLMVFGSFWYIRIIDSPYSLVAMMVLAPTIFFGCLVSIYRGYFEGLRNMTPTAVSEVIEAFSKIAIGVVLAFVIIKVGVSQYESSGTVFGLVFESREDAYNTLLSFSVAASVFGITMGSMLSFIYLRVRFAVKKGDIPEEYYANSLEAISKRATFVKMCKIALPVGIGALVMSISGTIDAVVIQNLMRDMAISNPDALLKEFPDLGKKLADGSIHTCIWGYYSTAITFTSLVVAVTQVFGTSAMPNVTNSYTKGNRTELKESMESVLRLTTMFAFPCAFGLAVLGGPILALVYPSAPDIHEYGGEVLMVLGLSVMFMGTITPLCSMLQGVGKVKETMFIYIFGTVVKILTSFLFARIPEINIIGAAIGSLVSNFLMCLAAMIILVRSTKIIPNMLNSVLKPFLGAIACGVGAYLFKYVLQLNLIISIVISAIIYIMILLILHTFTRSDVERFPKGKKIVIILEKLHLLG